MTLLTPTGVYRVVGRADLTVQFQELREVRVTEEEMNKFLDSPRTKYDRVLCMSKAVAVGVVLEGYFQGKVVQWNWNGLPYNPTPGQVLSVRATWDAHGFGSRPVVKEIAK